MTKKREDKLVAVKEKEWEEIASPFNNFMEKMWKEIKRDWKTMINNLMYAKKPKDKVDKFIHEFYWWGFVILIFFALKGFTYWLTGR